MANDVAPLVVPIWVLLALPCDHLALLPCRIIPPPPLTTSAPLGPLPMTVSVPKPFFVNAAVPVMFPL